MKWRQSVTIQVIDDAISALAGTGTKNDVDINSFSAFVLDKCISYLLAVIRIFDFVQ
jgi:hypothetical protein